MASVGTPEQPLRVAVIGAGPTGFYAADHLLRQKDVSVSVDLYDRLPTPFGLVRGGVAPDHQKIKSVTRVFDKVAANPAFRFFGHVEVGKDVTVEELQAYYHQIFFATGAQADRSMGIPGEDLAGSHSATEFVAWYNGHPDYCHLQFDLSQERVAVVGVGNVAIDVARILCRTPEELMATDIADYALEALRHSRVREVYVLGRRGPAQAAFTTPEVRELGEMAGAEVVALPEEVALDPLSAAALAAQPDKSIQKNIEILQGYAQRPPGDKPRTLIFRFLVSPTEILDDGAGRVGGVRIVSNELYADERGGLRPRATDRTEVLPVGLVFRSVGYRGVPVPGAPFDERSCTIAHTGGRVVDPATRAPIMGLYTGGWIKRGPSGVIGTNKPCAVETAEAMLADLAAGRLAAPAHPSPEAAERFIRSRQPHYFTYADWQKLDQHEVSRGAEAGRPRVKLTRILDMVKALGR